MRTYQGELWPFLSARNGLTSSGQLLRLSGYALASCLAFTVTDAFPFQIKAQESQISNLKKKQTSVVGRTRCSHAQHCHE